MPVPAPRRGDPGEALTPPNPSPPVFRVLTSAQERVLAVLARSRGPLSRTAIGQVLNRFKVGYVRGGIVVGEAVGPSDAAARAKLEQKTRKPTLLGLGYVTEREYDIEGLTELGLKITPLGREALTRIEASKKAWADRYGVEYEPILPDLLDESQADDDAPPRQAVM